jgi:hypothetical protein
LILPLRSKDQKIKRSKDQKIKRSKIAAFGSSYMGMVFDPYGQSTNVQAITTASSRPPTAG